MKTLKLVIADATQLYQCYMPFIECGGIFIPSEQSIEMGEMITLDLELFEAKHCIIVPVVWKTPSAAVGRLRPMGVGVQFSAEHEALCAEMETLLVGINGGSVSRFTI